MRRLLIFDFDGVIVNSEPHHIAACEEIVRRLSGGRVGADAVHTVGGSTESLYRRALEVCGAAGDAAALAREHFALTLARIRRDAPRPEPELTALLDALDGRGVATAVATSSPAGFVREILALYDLAGRFPVVVTGDQAARLKPAPDVYLLALARCGADAACAAAIEDPDFVTFMNNNGQAISYLDAQGYADYLKQAAVDVAAAMDAVGL